MLIKTDSIIQLDEVKYMSSELNKIDDKDRLVYVSRLKTNLLRPLILYLGADLVKSLERYLWTNLVKSRGPVYMDRNTLC